jgi:hypothetical protein
VIARSIILESFRSFGGIIHPGELSRVSGIQGAHHSVEEFKSTGFKSDFGDLGTWVVLTVARSINWHISWGDCTLLAIGPNC